MGGRKSRTLELLAFDEYCRFDTSAFVEYIKRGSLFVLNESISIKTAIHDIHRKLRVTPSEREGKLSNPRARRMRKMHGENLRKFM
jgi:hypothetical protein